jgi:7-cyano-7-deazaguanine reductase
MRLTARFYVRGGIFTTIIVEHKKKGFKPENPIQLPELSNERATY